MSSLVPEPNLTKRLFKPIYLRSEYALNVTLANSAQFSEEIRFVVSIISLLLNVSQPIWREFYLTNKLPNDISFNRFIQAILPNRVYSINGFSLLIFISLSKKLTRTSKYNSGSPHIFEGTQETPTPDERTQSNVGLILVFFTPKSK